MIIVPSNCPKAWHPQQYQHEDEAEENQGLGGNLFRSRIGSESVIITTKI